MFNLIVIGLSLLLTVGFPANKNDTPVGIDFGVCAEEGFPIVIVVFEKVGDTQRVELSLLDETLIGVSLQDTRKEEVTDLYVLQPNGSVKHHKNPTNEEVNREYPRGWCTSAKRFLDRRGAI